MGEKSDEEPGASEQSEGARQPFAGADAAVKLDTSAQALIGQQLRAVYGEIVKEPIPDHLLKLLEDLERKDEVQ
jgi:Anti-sigma factor NepR